mmetsp:Transcript_36149/g.35103  ORF Transcript_36149/g.35103 Transcript_36149/m.35103 type:complete len:105 (+) Transcript_36149:833-1147(+)
MVKIWQVNTGKEACSLKQFQKPIIDLCVSLDNEHLIASSCDNNAVIFKLKTMRTMHTLSGHKDNINACRLSFSKKQAITGSMDRTIKYWDIENGICSKTNICMS